MIELDPIYGCWLYKGLCDRDGYPPRHLYRGGCKPGEQADHLCRRRNCIRPGHIEAVSQRVNKQRMRWKNRIQLTRCPGGHDYFRHGRRTPQGGVVCLTCCPISLED